MPQSETVLRCAVVVPCYNEERRLDAAELVRFLRDAPPWLSLVFVDDGSRDRTLDLLEQVRHQAGQQAVVLAKKPNAGKAEAVRHGMNYALQQMQADVTGFFDADLATPLPAIFDLLDVLQSNPQLQMVFGSRVKLLGRNVERRAQRHYLGRVFATVVSNVLGLPIYDTQCGAKLFRATPDLAAVLKDPFLSRWIFDVEIIARFIRLKGADWVQNAIYEFPLHEWRDVAGSKVRPSDFVKAAGEVLMIRNKYLKG